LEVEDAEEDCCKEVEVRTSEKTTNATIFILPKLMVLRNLKRVLVKAQDVKDCCWDS
jgi:hypothetical protein